MLKAFRIDGFALTNVEDGNWVLEGYSRDVNVHKVLARGSLPYCIRALHKMTHVKGKVSSHG